MSDIRSNTSTSGSTNIGSDKHKAQSSSMQPHSESKAAGGRESGASGDEVATRPESSGRAVSTYDPFAMRLGFGNWDNWGWGAPSLLDQTFSTMLEPFGGFQRTSAMMNDIVRVPTLDLNENATGYELSCDLPGVPKEQVKVDLNGRTLTLSAERKEERSSDRSYSRSFGTFSRSLVLPVDSDLERIDAKYNHGQLKLTIPKQSRSTETPRNISIA